MMHVNIGKQLAIGVLSLLFAVTLSRATYLPYIVMPLYGKVDQETYWRFWVYTELLGARRFSLKSHGGYVKYAYKLADLARRRNVEVIANDVCLSACALVFLAAQKRTIAPRGIIGFHNSGIGMVKAFEELSVPFTPALEKDVGHERRFLSKEAQSLLVEAMDRIDVREAFLAPFEEPPHEVVEHTRSYYYLWVPEEVDYDRLGVEVTFMEPKISACEAWERLADRPNYRIVFGARPIERECAPKAD